MSDFRTIRNRILDELDRDDLSAQAELAIKSAVEFYSPRRFWFNEARATASTVADQEYYPLPDDFVAEDVLTISVNDTVYPLRRVSNEQIDDWTMSTSVNTGRPQEYALQGTELRLYPVPDDSYTLTMSYQKRLTELAAEGDSNAWTTDAEELIRRRAEGDLCLSVLQDNERATGFYLLASDVLAALLTRSMRHVGTGYTRKRMW